MNIPPIITGIWWLWLKVIASLQFDASFLTFRYIELNVQCHEGCRSYKDEVPPFLHNRPRKMVIHIMERWETDIITEHISIATLGCLKSRKVGVNSHMTSDMGMTRTFHTVNGEGIDFLASNFVPVWKPFQSSGGRNSLNQNTHQIHCFVLMTRW
mgnify:CR=1 FL=1